MKKYEFKMKKLKKKSKSRIVKTKCPFKVGDMVRCKHIPRYKIGKVVMARMFIKVEWDLAGYSSTRNHSPDDLELLETPIERMKRRYEESIQKR